MNDLPVDADADALATSCGFAAGTLVHTPDGLKLIERIVVGDMVLSQPSVTGAQAYKRVMRIVHHEPCAIARLYFYGKRDKEPINEQLLTTARHQFYVGDYHNGDRFSDEYWDEMNKPIGWRRADWLESHQLVDVAEGDRLAAGMFDRIWRTRTDGMGWIETNPDSTMGHNVRLSDWRATAERRPWDDADFAGVDSFNERYETPELQELWGYKLPVHDLEVEDFHTYYVGERGLLAHDATSVA
jgi:hypothetical protein